MSREHGAVPATTALALTETGHDEEAFLILLVWDQDRVFSFIVDHIQSS